MLGVARLIIFKKVECTGQLKNTKGFIDRNRRKLKWRILKFFPWCGKTLHRSDHLVATQ